MRIRKLWRRTSVLCIALAIPMAIAPRVFASTDIRNDSHNALNATEIEELEAMEAQSETLCAIGSGEENQFLQIMGVLFIVILVLALIGAAAAADDEKTTYRR